MGIADKFAAKHAQRSELGITLGSVASNVVITAGTVSSWSHDFYEGEPITGAADLRNGSMVLIEAMAREQFVGGFGAAQEMLAAGETPEKQQIVEVTVAFPGLVLGAMEDGEFVALPEYGEELYAPIFDKTALGFFKSPFRANPATVESLRALLVDNSYTTPPVHRQDSERSKTLWWLQAPSTAARYGAQLRDRLLSGIQLEAITIVPPRPVEQRRQDPMTGKPRPEFEGFVDAFTANIDRVVVATAAEEANAQKLDSSITGVEMGDNGPNPQRATLSELAVTVQTGPRKWNTENFSFWSEKPAAAAPAA